MLYHAVMSLVSRKSTKVKSSNKRTVILTQKRIAYIIVGIVGVLLVTNVMIYQMYKNKTYPKTMLNDQLIGSQNYTEIKPKTKQIVDPPQKITLKLGDKSKESTPQDLGISINYDSIINQIKQNRAIIPMINLLKTNKTSASFSANTETTNKYLESVRKELETNAVPAHVELENAKFKAVSAKAPITLDIDASTKAITEQLHNNKTTVDLQQKKEDPPESNLNPEEETAKLNDSLSTVITIKFDGQSKSVTKAQIANLYEPKNNTFVLSQTRISELIMSIAKQLNVSPGNKQQLIDQMAKSLQSPKNTELYIQPAPKKQITYTYCVSAKGVDSSYLGAFRSKLQEVYADARGWSVGGQIRFAEVASGCNYTAWLTRADLVPSFSSTICDNIWSCRVGNNVIINFDRWSGASPAWNNAGGSLDSYRTMVINHETGHWLGFYHRYCGGTGQPAPVMQQQSISLQGCAFNSWPTAPEIQSLKSSRGL